MQTCPKCGYSRNLSDNCPSWQCPHCGIAYAKAEYLYQPRPQLRPAKKSRPKPLLWLLIMLLMAVIGIFHQIYQQLTRPPAAVAVTTALNVSEANSPPVSIHLPPLQTVLNGKVSGFNFKDYSVLPLADFALEAKVLSKENYWLGRTAELSPTDLALGWGSMATPEMLEKVSISQRGRWFYWYVARDFTPELGREISSHASNMHIIPATPEVAQTLQAVKKGQRLYLKGYLVEVSSKDGWRWRSSLSREDTGDGACELIWVQQLEIRGD